MGEGICLVGASGYTGRIARDLCPEATPVVRSTSAERGLRGDIRDVGFARLIASSAQVVLNFVGPFDNYARVLARACAEAGTDYVDITGEPHFVAWSHATLDGIARSTGARLLHAVATESLPAMLLAAEAGGRELALRYRMHLPLMSPGSRITAALSTTRPPVWSRGGQLAEVPPSNRNDDAGDGLWVVTSYPDVVLLPLMGHGDVVCWLHLRKWAAREGPAPSAEELWSQHAARPRPGPPEALRKKTEVQVTLEQDGRPTHRAVVRDSYRFTAAAALCVGRALGRCDADGGVHAVPQVLSVDDLWTALEPYGLTRETLSPSQRSQPGG